MKMLVARYWLLAKIGVFTASAFAGQEGQASLELRMYL